MFNRVSGRMEWSGLPWARVRVVAGDCSEMAGMRSRCGWELLERRGRSRGKRTSHRDMLKL